MNTAAAGPLIAFYAFGAGPSFRSIYDLGLKKGGPLSESDNTISEWEKNEDLKKVVRIPGWSVL